jgi:lipoate-protein ligase A
MPCRDGCAVKDPERVKTTREAELEHEIAILTEFLCTACTEMEGDTLGVKKLEKLNEWWKAHKKKDAERKAKLVKSGLAKLTAEEKEALGL